MLPLTNRSEGGIELRVSNAGATTAHGIKSYEFPNDGPNRTEIAPRHIDAADAGGLGSAHARRLATKGSSVNRTQTVGRLPCNKLHGVGDCLRKGGFRGEARESNQGFEPGVFQ